MGFYSYSVIFTFDRHTVFPFICKLHFIYQTPWLLPNFYYIHKKNITMQHH